MLHFDNRISTALDFSYGVAMPLRGFGDMPIGNPHSGPLNGKREMPFAIAAGVAAGAAMAAGAAVTAAGVISIIAGVAVAAGLAMVVVGVVTGDKDLMKIGGITMLAGGVANMAFGASIAASTAAEAAAVASEEAAVSATSAAAQAAIPVAASQGGGVAAAGISGSGTAGIVSGSEQALSVGFGSQAGTASSAVTQSVGGTSLGSLGVAGNSALATALPTAGNVGVEVGSTIGTSSGGFFDTIKSAFTTAESPAATVGKDVATTGTSLKDLIQPAGQIIGAIGQSNSTDDYIKSQQATAENQLAFNKTKYNQQLASANTQGNLNLSALPWTPNNGQLTPAQIAAHVQLDAQGNPIPPKAGMLA